MCGGSAKEGIFKKRSLFFLVILFAESLFRLQIRTLLLIKKKKTRMAAVSATSAGSKMTFSLITDELENDISSIERKVHVGSASTHSRIILASATAAPLLSDEFVEPVKNRCEKFIQFSQQNVIQYVDNEEIDDRESTQRIDNCFIVCVCAFEVVKLSPKAGPQVGNDKTFSLLLKDQANANSSDKEQCPTHCLVLFHEWHSDCAPTALLVPEGNETIGEYRMHSVCLFFKRLLESLRNFYKEFKMGYGGLGDDKNFSLSSSGVIRFQVSVGELITSVARKKLAQKIKQFNRQVSGNQQDQKDDKDDDDPDNFLFLERIYNDFGGLQRYVLHEFFKLGSCSRKLFPFFDHEGGFVEALQAAVTVVASELSPALVNGTNQVLTGEQTTKLACLDWLDENCFVPLASSLERCETRFKAMTAEARKRLEDDEMWSEKNAAERVGKAGVGVDGNSRRVYSGRKLGDNNNHSNSAAFCPLCTDKTPIVRKPFSCSNFFVDDDACSSNDKLGPPQQQNSESEVIEDEAERYGNEDATDDNYTHEVDNSVPNGSPAAKHVSSERNDESRSKTTKFTHEKLGEFLRDGCYRVRTIKATTLAGLTINKNNNNDNDANYATRARLTSIGRISTANPHQTVRSEWHEDLSVPPEPEAATAKTDDEETLRRVLKVRFMDRCCFLEVYLFIDPATNSICVEKNLAFRWRTILEYMNMQHKPSGSLPYSIATTTDPLLLRQDAYAQRQPTTPLVDAHDDDDGDEGSTVTGNDDSNSYKTDIQDDLSVQRQQQQQQRDESRFVLHRPPLVPPSASVATRVAAAAAPFQQEHDVCKSTTNAKQRKVEGRILMSKVPGIRLDYVAANRLDASLEGRPLQQSPATGETVRDNEIEEARKYLYSSQQLKSILYQFLLELGKLHDSGIIHFDVKCDNAFLSSFGKVRIIDYGCAFLLNRYVLSMKSELRKRWQERNQVSRGDDDDNESNSNPQQQQQQQESSTPYYKELLDKLIDGCEQIVRVQNRWRGAAVSPSSSDSSASSCCSHRRPASLMCGTGVSEEEFENALALLFPREWNNATSFYEGIEHNPLACNAPTHYALRSPEMNSSERHRQLVSGKSDVWSFGNLVMFMLLDRYPFTLQGTRAAFVENEWAPRRNANIPFFWEEEVGVDPEGNPVYKKCDVLESEESMTGTVKTIVEKGALRSWTKEQALEMLKFAKKCLNPHPKGRPTVCELLSDSFFDDIRHRGNARQQQGSGVFSPSTTANGMLASSSSNQNGDSVEASSISTQAAASFEFTASSKTSYEFFDMNDKNNDTDWSERNKK